MLAAAVGAASFGKLLDHVLSVDTIRIYKPRREVYALASTALALSPVGIGFVSSNRWDVAGAAAAGMMAIWINRSGAPAEYGEFAPAATLRSLDELAMLSL
jgi:2-haloacid dehalogenase